MTSSVKECLAGLLKLLPCTFPSSHIVVWHTQCYKNWWPTFSPLRRKWLSVLGERGLGGRKVFLWSSCCMALITICNCGNVSLEQCREQSHWINPWKHNMSNFIYIYIYTYISSFKLQRYSVTWTLSAALCAQIILLGDEPWAADVYGIHWAAVYLQFSLLACSAPLVWVLWSWSCIRSDATPSPCPQSDSSFLFIFTTIIPLTSIEILKVSEDIWDSLRLNLAMLVHS